MHAKAQSTSSYTSWNLPTVIWLLQLLGRPVLSLWEGLALTRGPLIFVNPMPVLMASTCISTGVRFAFEIDKVS